MKNQWTPKALRELRRHRRWTQQELASALMVAVTTVSRWENGHSSPNPLAQHILSSIAGKSANAKSDDGA